MPITYTNATGTTFYLCCRDNARRNFFFSQELDKYPAAAYFPAGYLAVLTANGQPKLMKAAKVPRRSIVLALCRQCSTLIPEGSLESHQRAVHHQNKPQAKTRSRRRSPATMPSPTAADDNSVACPLCGVIMPRSQFEKHINSSNCHPHRENRPVPRTTQLSPGARRAQRRGRRQRKQEWVVDVEPSECGWCYQPVYRVWQKNGYYRYYEDKELNDKHVCTRPAGWDPDKK